VTGEKAFPCFMVGRNRQTRSTTLRTPGECYRDL